jgi:hypothetical protein
MSSPAPKPGPNPPPDPDPNVLPPGPPPEEFWEKYNKRLEFPLSTVGAVFLHVAVGALVVFILLRMAANATDRASVPLVLADVGGLDDSGSGSEGSGGVDEPLFRPTDEPFKPIEVMPIDPNLPEAQANPNTTTLPDAAGNLAPPTTPRPVGAEKGSGKEPGKGYDGTKGKGPGGTGADSTRARNLRWIIRFRTSSGRDYLDQLRVMGARVIIPVPGGNKQYVYVPDLANLAGKRPPTKEEESELAGMIKFGDNRAESVRQVAQELGLDFNPQAFWAVFPKNIEEELERKEKGYRNRRAEQIEETVFRVIMRGGNYEIVVEDQTVKR